MSAATSAVRALARSELRRRWRALVLLGLAVGLVVGTVAATAAVARRTGTALDRLRTATAAEDARVQLFAPDPLLVDAVVGQPGVESSWAAVPMVGRVPGTFTYLALLSGEPPPEDLFQPIVVEGRRADPASADEAMVAEAFAAELGFDVGDTLALELLTADEVRQFDVGFGDPDGATVQLTITGIVRMPPGSLDQNPVIVGGAFAERHAPESAVGAYVLVRLADGRAGYQRFTEGVAEAAAPFAPPEGGEEFPVADVSDLDEPAAAVAGARRVLGTGLALVATVAGLAGALVLAQAFARHHAASATDQRVEAALGLTSGERAAARTLPALPAAGLAAVVAAVVVLVAGLVEPLGPLGPLEPEPGWRPDGLAAVVAAVVAAGVVAGLAWTTARRAGRRRVGAPVPSSSSVRARGVALARRPALVAGLWFSLFPGRAGRAIPVRSAVLSAVVGVAGLVGALTFADSLHRLDTTPSRWGWVGDVAVVDATPAIVEELVDDPRTEAVSLMSFAALDVDGQGLGAWALQPAEGHLDWTVLDGRLVEGSDEIALGPRAAEELGVGVGDTVTVTGRDGTSQALEVVGTVLVPVLSPVPLGSESVVAPEVLRGFGLTSPFNDAMVELAAGVDAAAYADELAGRYELDLRRPPAEVANLAELGALPVLLGGFLAALGALALTHALVVMVRRRGPDLAVLRAVGFTPGQAGASVLGTGLATAAAGTLVGVPLGLAVARLAWWVAATDAAVAPDVSVPWGAVAVVAPGALALAGAVALLPARRATRVRPGPLLRVE